MLPSTHFSIEQVTNSHDIIRIIHAAFERYKNDPMPSSALLETAQTIEKELLRGLKVFGIFEDGELFGVVKATTYADYLYFARLAVIPNQQRKGIASALLLFLESYAKELKLQRIECKVRKSETDNIRLYKNLGYKIVKEEQTQSPTGFIMDTVTMEKMSH
jgi:ribosomal protein S18 acetylase RimI-like enzyme